MVDERQISLLFVVTPGTLVFSDTVPERVIFTPPSVSVQKVSGLTVTEEVGIAVGGTAVANIEVVGIAVGILVGIAVGTGVFVGIGVLVGRGVLVGALVGVFVGIGVLVGMGVAVTAGVIPVMPPIGTVGGGPIIPSHAPLPSLAHVQSTGIL